LKIVDENSWIMWSLEDDAAAMSLTEQAAPGRISRTDRASGNRAPRRACWG
jgi:hypothetical protein